MAFRVIIILTTLYTYQLQVAGQMKHFEQINVGNCTCPNELVMFQCTIVGNGFTRYNVTGCSDEVLLLPHSTSEFGKLVDCGCQVNSTFCFKAQGISNDSSVFTSALYVTLFDKTAFPSTGLNVSCLMDVEPVGETITLFPTVPQPPSDIVISTNNPLHITWTNIFNCQVEYIVDTFNCGTCPNTTYDNFIDCTIGEDFAGTEHNCTVSVMTKACGNISSPRTISMIIPAMTTGLSVVKIAVPIVVVIVTVCLVVIIIVVLVKVKKKKKCCTCYTFCEKNPSTLPGAQIQMLAKDLGEHCSTTPHNQEVYEENKKLKQRLEENERDQREKEEQIRELQTDRDELHRKLQTLLANKEEAERRLEQEVLDLKKEIEELRKELQTKDCKEKRLKEELNNLKTKNWNLHKDLHQLQMAFEDERRSLRKQLADVQESILTPGEVVKIATQVMRCQSKKTISSSPGPRINNLQIQENERMVYTNPTLEVAEDINNVTQLQLQDEAGAIESIHCDTHSKDSSLSSIAKYKKSYDTKAGPSIQSKYCIGTKRSDHGQQATKEMETKTNPITNEMSSLRIIAENEQDDSSIRTRLQDAPPNDADSHSEDELESQRQTEL